MEHLSRRGFLAALGASGAGWAAFAWSDVLAAGAHVAKAASEAPAPAFQLLTAEQAADLEAIAAQIIPTDDTPGAREARVVHFFDRALATFAKDMRKPLEEGLADLRGRIVGTYPGIRNFARLDDAKQKAMLKRIEKTPFFDMMRGATIAGMFANPEYGGNHDKIGWKLLGFEDRFSWAPPYGYYDKPGVA